MSISKLTLDGEGRIVMGIGRSMAHKQGKENAVKTDDNQLTKIVCGEELRRDMPVSEMKAGNIETVMESSGVELTNVSEENEDKLCKNYESEIRRNLIQSGISPSNVAIGDQPIDIIEPKDRNKLNCSKCDKSFNIVCKDKSQKTCDCRRVVLKVKHAGTSCDFPSKYPDVHPNECSINSCLKENCYLKQDEKRGTESNNSIYRQEKLQTMITGVTVPRKKNPDVYLIGASTKDQHCEFEEPGMLKGNCNSNESEQKGKEKHINDSEINLSSVDTSSGIVNGENVQQQFYDNSIKKEFAVPQEVENISEYVNYRMSESSVREMGDLNISDLSANMGMSVVNETLNAMQSASEDGEVEQNKNYTIPLESIMLKENNYNSNESEQKRKEKHVNDSEIHLSSVDASSDIVDGETVQQQFDDSSIEKELGVSQEVENISENVDFRMSELSVREIGDQNISDLSANIGTDIVSETLNVMQSSSEVGEDEQNENNAILENENSVEKLPNRSLFRRGLFPRIALREGGREAIRRIENLIRREREKKQRILSSSSQDSRRVKKQKAANRKSANHFSEKVGKKIEAPDPLTDPKLQCLQVRLERIDERMLSQYKMDLQNNDKRTVDKKDSNEDISSTNCEVFGSVKNQKHLEDSTNYQMLKDSSVNIVENTKLPTKKVIKKVKKTQFKPCTAKLIKPLRVKILKMDDVILSKYGYGSQKVKASNATVIQKTRNLSMAKSIKDEHNVCKEMTDQQLKLNHVKYPAQICLTKIDSVYPNIMKQTLKLKKNSRNNSENNIVVKKTTKISASNVSDSHKPIHLKTINVSIAEEDDVTVSKYDSGVKKARNNRKSEPIVVSNVNVANESGDVPPVSNQSQKTLTSKKQTVFKNCEFDNLTLKVLRTSQKGKIDSYNVIMDDYSKENVCLNGESRHLKCARVSLTKLDI